jgi:hypothetical protein
VGEFFWKVVDQGHRKNRPRDETRQGNYIATADGQLLGSDHAHWSIERYLSLLRSSLERFEAIRVAKEAETASAADPQFARVPPEGGLILKVYSRIPIQRQEGETWTPNHATGRDHMWLTRDEWRSLLPTSWKNGERYPIPPAVAERLIRFHLVDNVRGEPPMWAREHIREQDLAVVVEDAAAGRLRLEGGAKLQTHDGQRGYDARLQGIITTDPTKQRFNRFDVLAWGEFWGEGRYTGGAPKGRFPLLIAFSRAGDLPADRVPPQGSREFNAYFGTGR